MYIEYGDGEVYISIQGPDRTSEGKALRFVQANGVKGLVRTLNPVPVTDENGNFLDSRRISFWVFEGEVEGSRIYVHIGKYDWLL